MSVLARQRTPEWMDFPGVDSAELGRSLGDIRNVNRWLGGTRAALAALMPMLLRAAGIEPTVLDVATGSGDIPLAVVREAREAGLRVHVTASDLHPRTLAAARSRAARDPDVDVVPANALALPFPDGHFDFAMCHTALHHFERPDAIQVLRELKRVARRGVAVTDLRRSRAALGGARLLAASVWRRHPVTRHDGPRSVLAAFTRRELAELAGAAGLSSATVRNRPGFRVSLTADLAVESG